MGNHTKPKGEFLFTLSLIGEILRNLVLILLLQIVRVIKGIGFFILAMSDPERTNVIATFMYPKTEHP